jgi:L-cysteine/cystine lyase
VPWSDARRFDAADLYGPAIVGFARSLGWLTMHVGLPWCHDRGPALARATAGRLAAVRGIELITPRDRMATIVAFRIAGWSAQQALDELGARCFAIAEALPELDALRLSVGWFTSAAALERFVATVESLAAHTPATMPARRRLEVVGGS